MTRILLLALVSSLTSTAFSAPIYFSGTGHWYEVVSAPTGINWTDAKTSAESSQYDGTQGHLATIESQAENDFVWYTLGNSTLQDFWLGGSQTVCTPEPDCGWNWVTGEAWTFTNWYPNEPNNLASGTENALEFLGSATGNNLTGQWNDVSDQVSNMGFIVEYDTVPIPAGAWLFGSALGLLGCVWRRVAR